MVVVESLQIWWSGGGGEIADLVTRWRWRDCRFSGVVRVETLQIQWRGGGGEIADLVTWWKCKDSIFRVEVGRYIAVLVARLGWKDCRLSGGWG